MQCTTNLEQMKYLEVMCSEFHVTWWALHAHDKVMFLKFSFKSKKSLSEQSFNMDLISS